MSDHELLQRYTRDHSQTAFATLVERHLDLVYSAAHRQLRSPHLAEEVAQTVFIELARCASKIPEAQPLAAWLYVVTRRTAIDAIRREARRLARETTAAEIATMKTPPEAWSKVEASIDEAMETLNDTERTAIVLRFFQNLSLREVGESLGISEDTAQKRVSRALDRLRVFFAGRGVAVTGAALATDLSAHAVGLAPAGLGIAISAQAALSPAMTAAASQLLMTTTQKTLLGVTLALTLGAGVFEARIVSQQRDELQNLQQRTDTLLTEARTARLAYERTSRTLDASRATKASPPDATPSEAAGDEALATAMRAWLGRVDRLKRTLAQHPELSIPELALLEEQIWFSIAQDTPMETDAEVRDVIGRLRSMAENSIANKIGPALRAYVSAHEGELPARVPELAPFFSPSVEPAMLQRYEMMRTGKLSDIPSGAAQSNLIILQSPVDPDRDTIWRMGTNSFSNESAVVYAVRLAQKEFATAHNGATATTSDELQPYLKWSVDPGKVNRFLKLSR